MCKKKVIISLFLLQYSIIQICSQSVAPFKIIDSQTKVGIPYAYIRIANRQQFITSDMDGYFSISCKPTDTLIISNIAYQKVKIPFNVLQKIKVIKMVELPIELNSVRISAKDAERVVKKAIKCTYDALTKPMYFKCLRRDNYIFRDTLIMQVKSEILMELMVLFSPSHGGKINCYLNNIIVEKRDSISNKKIPKYSSLAISSPFNRFIAGVSRKDDEVVNFSYQDVKDSIIIVSFAPKLSNKPDGKYIYKQGRFVINRITGKILRIDSFLSQDMMKYQRDCMDKKKTPSIFYYDYSLSQYFNNLGYLEGVHWQFSFSQKVNDQNKIWSSKSDLEFYFLDQRPNGLEKLSKLDSDSTLIDRNSNFKPGFEKEFNECFFKNSRN
jgi:hypothetical protein